MLNTWNHGAVFGLIELIINEKDYKVNKSENIPPGGHEKTGRPWSPNARNLHIYRKTWKIDAEGGIAGSVNVTRFQVILEFLFEISPDHFSIGDAIDSGFRMSRFLFRKAKGYT